MGCKIIFSPLAIADLEAAVRFIAKDNPAAAVSRPYIIFYRTRLEENCVDILRYWHGARNEPEL